MNVAVLVDLDSSDTSCLSKDNSQIIVRIKPYAYTNSKQNKKKIGKNRSKIDKEPLVLKSRIRRTNLDLLLKTAILRIKSRRSSI